MDNQRNLLLAVVLCGLLIFGWDAATRYFYPQPVETAATAPRAPETQAASRAGLDATATPATAPSNGSNKMLSAASFLSKARATITAS